ncbi:unnamed protein product [Allacma fusca]|uniref:RNA polymerase II-associated factor 1 homolog n=1 Tax=Allacma fusca TaxID=39272 RepID=A0A8J2JKJ4_9HEXA|nr:unnamed protein product [Allacma fusca]
MAPIPTVQNSAEKRSSRPLGSSERKSELVTRVSRFVNYSTTSLERNYTYEVLTEADLGVDVELVIPNAYNLPPNAPIPALDPADERLLEDESVPQKDLKRSRHHTKSVSWLRRTEYISTEQTRFQPQTIDKVEAKVGYSVKKMLKDDLGHYMDRDSQVKSIEKTFEDSLIPIETHFAKPGVTPVEILPVFPDFKLWKYPCAQVIFDSDPAPVGRPVPAQLEEMSQAMIRGVMDESGEQFVAYFLPTEETLEKRRLDVEEKRDYEDDQVYEYRMAREYNWNVKSKATKGYEENYFFTIRDDGVYYNELETRVRLNKRRLRGPNQQLNTKLCVKHMPLAASDYKFQRKREKELEPLAEDDEDEEEEEKSEAEDEKSDKSDNESDTNEKSKSKKSDDEHEKSDKSDDEKPVRSRRIKSDESDDEHEKSDKSDSEDERRKSGDERRSKSRSRSASRSRSRSRSGSRSPASDKSEKSDDEPKKPVRSPKSDKSDGSEHSGRKSASSDSDDDSDSGKSDKSGSSDVSDDDK